MDGFTVAVKETVKQTWKHYNTIEQLVFTGYSSHIQ